MSPAAGRGLVERVLPHAGRLGLAALTLFLAIGLLGGAVEQPGIAVPAALVALAAGVALCRDGRPVLAWVVLGAAGVAVLGDGHAARLSWFGICILGAWCVFTTGTRAVMAYWLGVMTLFAVEWGLAPDAGWGAWMAGTTFTMLSGTLLVSQLGLVARLREAQAGLAERSREQERARIARDLHDVIAHSLTVSLLHVTSARLAVQHEPERAAEALAEAERLGRQSLGEVRSIVGLLGTDPGELAAPVRGGADAAALVDGFRRAGADVRLTVTGDLDRLPATTGSVLYRILQEALTNAAKHASGRPARVRLTAAGDSVELVVDSDGPPGSGRGRGTSGMSERAHAVGGSCTAGPHAGGWRVHASLPFREMARGGTSA